MRLSGIERKTISTCAKALLPEGGPLPQVSNESVARVASFLEELDRRMLFPLRMGLVLFELLPLISRHHKRLSKLEVSERSVWLAWLEGSKHGTLRDITLMVKLLIMIAHGSDPSLQRALGYEARCELGAKSKAPAAPVKARHSVGLAGKRDFDAIVVGSGAGGAVAAYNLARAGLSVAIVEEGSYYNRENYESDPLKALATLYRDSGMTYLNGPLRIPLPVGRCVGGTTLINSGTCFRAPGDVLAQWRSEHGIEWADEETLTPIFERLERELLIEPVDVETMGENGRLCMEGAKELGASGGPINRYANGCVRCGTCPTGCQLDIKQATHISYIPRAVEAGAELFTNTKVKEVLVEGGRCVGVATTGVELRASKVVLAAGALGTPEVLLRSGLGSSNANIGNNLRVHPACWVGALHGSEVRGWEGIMQSYYVDEWHDRGLILEATFTPLPFAGPWLPGFGPAFAQRLASFGRVASIGVHLSDSSAGRLRLSHAGATKLSYRLSQRDISRIVFGIKRAADIHFASGAVEVYPHIRGMDVVRPGQQSGLLNAKPTASDLRLEAFHPMGTARMGANRSDSVVAPNGQYHGVEGLYVADASLFPTSLGVNPMLTIMAFADHISSLMCRK